MKRKIEKDFNTQESILNAALELFNEKGFQKTTLREIAQKAGTSLGAAYYYFPSKEAMVMSYYLRIQFRVDQKIPEIKLGSDDFFERFSLFMLKKFELLKPSRNLLKVINGIALNMDHPLSPFSEETSLIREDSVKNIQSLIEDTRLKLTPDVASFFPKILWLVHMSLLAFWIQDSSAKQHKSEKLLELVLFFLKQLLKLMKIPFPTQSRKKIVELLEIFHSSFLMSKETNSAEQNPKQWNKEFIEDLRNQFTKETL